MFALAYSLICKGHFDDIFSGEYFPFFYRLFTKIELLNSVEPSPR